MSHYRPKIKVYKGNTIGKNYDIFVYSTDVYFNKYPEYNISCGSYKSSVYLLDRRFINSMSSNLIRNVGFGTTQINNSPIYVLTDVESYQRHCIFWGNSIQYPNVIRYTIDRNITISNYSEDAWWNLVSTKMDVYIYEVLFSMVGNDCIVINTNPPIEHCYRK